MSDAEKTAALLLEVSRWVKTRMDIVAAALVGSWARGAARPDSDIDLLFLTSAAPKFRADEQWLLEINWQVMRSELAHWEDTDYGAVWSRRIYLADDSEIEFGFGGLDWAAVDPPEAGTVRVIGDGCRILYDPEGIFEKLVLTIHRLR